MLLNCSSGASGMWITFPSAILGQVYWESKQASEKKSYGMVLSNCLLSTKQLKSCMYCTIQKIIFLKK